MQPPRPVWTPLAPAALSTFPGNCQSGYTGLTAVGDERRRIHVRLAFDTRLLFEVFERRVFFFLLRPFFSEMPGLSAVGQQSGGASGAPSDGSIRKPMSECVPPEALCCSTPSRVSLYRGLSPLADPMRAFSSTCSDFVSCPVPSPSSDVDPMRPAGTRPRRSRDRGDL